MKYFSAFSGIGGMELGIQKAYETNRANRREESDETSLPPEGNQSDSQGGIGNEREQNQCIGYSEIDKYATQIYEKHFPEHKNYGDITKIQADTLPDFDLFVGGFPCQAFSIAGKRKGFDDTRGTLFFDIARILRNKEPLYALLENVKGLISHDGGKTLEIILETLQDLGYYVNYEVLNAKDFGVPQNRERIFFQCKHLKILLSVGQNKKMTSCEKTIQEWLFQLLLNNLKEVKKLQGLASKDWVAGWLLCQEISQNLKSNAENILDGISIEMGGESSLFRGDPWQNIDIWLNKELGGRSKAQSMFTILTAIKQTIESKTYSYSTMLRSILLATVLLRSSSKTLWNEILSSLILIQEDTKYARINRETKEIIVTESGTAHFAHKFENRERVFIAGCLGGFGGRQVFSFGSSNESVNGNTEIKQVNNPVHSNDRVYSEQGLAPTLNTMQGGNRQPFIIGGLQGHQNFTNDGISPTLTSAMGKGGGQIPIIANTLDANYHKGNSATKDRHTPRTQIEQGSRIRRLTPKECCRLMGYPDSWVDGISDTQKYKVLGNGIVSNVVEAVIKNMLF